MIPRVKNFGEAAGKARELASRYGTLTGRLTDAVSSYEEVRDTAALRQLMADFSAVKASRDLLTPYPLRETRRLGEDVASGRVDPGGR